MTTFEVKLADDVARLLVAIVDRAMSRTECAEIVGDPSASAGGLSLLRDLGFVRFDPRDRQWYATRDGMRALRPAEGVE